MYKKELKFEEKGEITTVSGKCVFTGEEHSVDVPTDGFKRWQAGELAQNTFPKIPADDREFLISGISPKGWKQTFGDNKNLER